MSSYRQHSFDPSGGGDVLPTPPTWMQRIGIGCLFVGAAVVFAYLAGQWGVIPKWVNSPMPGTVIVVMAGPLIGAGARRGPPSPKVRRQRLIIVAVGLAVFILALAAVLYLNGQTG